MARQITAREKRGKPKAYYTLSEKIEVIRLAKVYGRVVFKYARTVNGKTVRGLYTTKTAKKLPQALDNRDTELEIIYGD